MPTIMQTAYALPAASILALAGLAGCQGQDSARSNDAGAARLHLPAADPDVERRYVIGRTTARDLGYRIDWQVRTAAARPIELIEVSPDSVFALEEGNALMRVETDTGRRRWTIPIADDSDSILAVRHSPSREQITVYSQTTRYELDDATGSEHTHHRLRLDKSASTPPVRHGAFQIYGSRNGQLVWQSAELGAEVRAYQVAHSMSVAPAYEDGVVVGIGSGGRVMSLDASNASMIWTHHALDDIVAAPVMSDGIVYVAGLDQYIRAYDALRARPRAMWEFLTESALVDSPVVIDDRVFQQVPGTGLLSREANPPDSPGGVLVWTCAGTTGSVLTQRGNDLLVWDGSLKRLDVVDARFGEVIRSWELPSVDMLIATSPTEGDLIGTSRDGRMVRLVPSN